MFLTVEKYAKSKEINRLFPYISYDMNFWLFDEAARHFFQQKPSHRSPISKPEDNDPAFLSRSQEREMRKGRDLIQGPVKRKTRDMLWTNS